MCNMQYLYTVRLMLLRLVNIPLIFFYSDYPLATEQRTTASLIVQAMWRLYSTSQNLSINNYVYSDLPCKSRAEGIDDIDSFDIVFSSLDSSLPLNSH
jgi:hypothetical protein